MIPLEKAIRLDRKAGRRSRNTAGFLRLLSRGTVQPRSPPPATSYGLHRVRDRARRFSEPRDYAEITLDKGSCNETRPCHNPTRKARSGAKRVEPPRCASDDG